MPINDQNLLVAIKITNYTNLFDNTILICREWIWKGMTLDAGQWPGPDFMRAHTKVSLA